MHSGSLARQLTYRTRTVAVPLWGCSATLCAARPLSASASTNGQLRDDASSSAELSASPEDPLVAPFSVRLSTAPHRDITHVPYGDWFALYVKMRKRWRTLESSTGANAVLNAEEGVTLVRERAKTLTVSLEDARQRLDALLLSSIFARHWREVQPTTLSTIATKASRYRWWWHAEAYPSLQERASSSSILVPSQLELCTTGFMTEPLLGGSHLRLWMDDIRVASTAVTSRATEVNTGPSFCSDAPTVIIPFSVLWQVKQDAYQRPSVAIAKGRGDAPLDHTARVDVSPSLQERQARQTLLHSVDQLLQLQRDGEVNRNSTSGAIAHPLQRVCVLSPTQEWDLLCSLPCYRQVLCHTPQQSPSSKESGTASSPPPAWLSLSCLCENTPARIAYYVHVLNWQRGIAGAAGPSGTRPNPVRVLAPAAEHPLLRKLSLSSLQEHSCFREALRGRRIASASASMATATSGTSSTNIHQQARLGCSEAVRRFSHREENLRQSLSLR